jgi:hypothetical protein
MKRKNKEIGYCIKCGRETTIQTRRVKGMRHIKTFYCGCQGPRVG